MTTFEQAQQGFQKKAERVRRWNSMPLSKLEEERDLAYVWLQEHPNHPKIEEAKSRYGHLTMILQDRKTTQDIKNVQETMI